jgi:hypothetical protein
MLNAEERYRVEQELFECRCCGYFWITDLDPDTTPTFVFDSTRSGEEDRQRLRAEETATKLRAGID